MRMLISLSRTSRTRVHHHINAPEVVEKTILNQKTAKLGGFLLADKHHMSG